MPAADPEPPSSRPAESCGPRLELLLEIDDGVSGDVPDHAFLADWAGHALSGTLGRDAGAPATHVELSVRLVGVDAMRALNRDWRDRDAPTNVLSFPSGLPPLDADGGDTLLALGDVVLCPAVIEDEARVQGKRASDHWAHLVLHGVLHLCGLDHENDDDARIMEALEVRLLAARDLPDPYGDRASP